MEKYEIFQIGIIITLVYIGLMLLEAIAKDRKSKSVFGLRYETIHKGTEAFAFTVIIIWSATFVAMFIDFVVNLFQKGS